MPRLHGCRVAAARRPARVCMPRSGEGGGSSFWRSPSAIGSLHGLRSAAGARARAISAISTDARGARLAAVSRGLQWEDERQRRELTFTVAAGPGAVRRAAAALPSRPARAASRCWRVLLLLALALLLRWALAPLRRLDAQIHAVERGEREQLDERWPTELDGVVGEPQHAAAGRAHAHRALPRHARQSRAQPEDAAGRAARELCAGRAAAPRR